MDRHGIDPDTDEQSAPMGGEPSIDALMQQLKQDITGRLDGWDGLTDPAALMAKQRRDQQLAMKRQANDFRDCFMTPAGRHVLEHLLDQTLRARPYPVEANLTLDAITPLVIAHDAQCNFVWAILEAIALAENRQIQPRSQA